MIDVKNVLIIDDNPDDAFISSVLFRKGFPSTKNSYFVISKTNLRLYLQ